MTYHIRTLDDWEPLVKRILPQLTAGKILALSGPLGAGKTTFTQLLVQALGSKRIPTSPTFSLLHRYPVSGAGTGITRVLHVDAYRLESEEDMRVLNLDEELCESGRLVIIEWPERIPLWIKQKTSAVLPMLIELRAGERFVTIN